MTREGLEEAYFQRLRKAAYGGRVRRLNSFEYTCIGLAQAHFAGAELLSFPELYDTITVADVAGCIRDFFTRDRASLAVVRPKGEA